MSRRRRVRLSFEQHLLAAQRHIVDLSKSSDGGPRHAAKKSLYRANAAVVGDLKTLTPMPLRGKYKHEAYCHKNMLSRAKRNGAVVDLRLRTFQGFLLFLGAAPTPTHTIDRVDNGNPSYILANCQWATKQQQARNKSNTRRLTIGNMTKRLVEWAEETGQKPGTIRARLKRGQSPARAVFGRENVTKERARLETALRSLGIPKSENFREAFELELKAGPEASIKADKWLKEQVRQRMKKLRDQIHELNSTDSVDSFGDDERWEDMDEGDVCVVTEWYIDARARLEQELEVRVLLEVYRQISDSLTDGRISKSSRRYPTVLKVKAAVRTRDEMSSTSFVE